MILALGSIPRCAGLLPAAMFDGKVPCLEIVPLRAARIDTSARILECEFITC
jgi:hypothetical protein